MGRTYSSIVDFLRTTHHRQEHRQERTKKMCLSIAPILVWVLRILMSSSVLISTWIMQAIAMPSRRRNSSSSVHTMNWHDVDIDVMQPHVCAGVIQSCAT